MHQRVRQITSHTVAVEYGEDEIAQVLHFLGQLSHGLDNLLVVPLAPLALLAQVAVATIRDPAEQVVVLFADVERVVLKHIMAALDFFAQRGFEVANLGGT